MRRPFVRKAAAIFSAIFLFLPASCSNPPLNAADPSNAERLWKLDIGNGFVRSNASLSVKRYNQAYTMEFIVYPVEMKPALPSDATPLAAGGTEYKAWEGQEKSLGSGSMREKLSLFWERKSYAYALSVVSNQDGLTVPSEMASPAVAGKLEAEPLANMDGFRIMQPQWRTVFTKGESTITVSFSMSRADRAFDRIIIGSKDFTKIGDQDSECYTMRSKNEAENRQSISMYWYSNAGFFKLTGSAPSSGIEDPLGFINLDLAKRVTEQTGMKMKPFLSFAGLAESALKNEKALTPGNAALMRLCRLNADQGFVCQDASRAICWTGNNNKYGSRIWLYIYPDGQDDVIPSDAEELKEGGMTYKKVDSSITKGFTRTLYWEKEGIAYSLSATVDYDSQKEWLGVVTPQKAEALMKDPLTGIADYKSGGEACYAVFAAYAPDSGSKMQIDLTLYSPDRAETVRKIHGGLEEKQDGTVAYSVSIGKKSGTLLWNTDLGTFVLLVSASSEFTAKDRAFFDGSFIESINNQMGAKILPFPEASAKP